MAKLNNGPLDGLDVSGVCGEEEHFFVYDKRLETPKLAYYFRGRDQAIGGGDFHHQPVPPSGAVGKIVVLG